MYVCWKREADFTIYSFYLYQGKFILYKEEYMFENVTLTTILLFYIKASFKLKFFKIEN